MVYYFACVSLSLDLHKDGCNRCHLFVLFDACHEPIPNASQYYNGESLVHTLLKSLVKKLKTCRNIDNTGILKNGI